MAPTLAAVLATLLLCFTPSLALSDPSALSAGDGELINIIHGYYGSPVYRPYGYSAWGWGSEGYGYRPIVAAQPNTFYGGYFNYQYYPGF